VDEPVPERRSAGGLRPLRSHRNLDPASEDEDPYADDHRSIDFSPVVWSLLLKEARNLPSDEKLEFYLKGRENIAQLAGFDSVDGVPRNSTFWRAYADTDSDDPLDVDVERAYLDKGFYGGMCVTALRETETEFLIKSRKGEPVKDVIDGLEEWDVDWGIMQDYEIGDRKQGTNIFIRPSEKRAPRYGENTDEEDKKYDRWVAFVTDIDPVTADREKLARQFRNRWGVETQYRQFNHNVYAPTKSPNGRVRAFHCNLAQLFYNIWVVVNPELRDRYRLAERRPVTADDVLHAIRDEAFELDDLPE